jgi:hypothetical protein
MLSSLAGSLAKCEQGDEPVYGALASLAEAVSADYVRLKCLNKEFVWNGETYSKIEPNSENCYVLTVQVQKGRSICGEDGELAVYRGLESQDFAEPDRYLTQTVADMLCATILS